MVRPVRPQFVLFGSSIVQFSFNNGGWGSILANIYSRKDEAVQPSLVIVYFGGNDSVPPHPSGLGAHVPLAEYIENMRKIAIHLKSLSEKTRVIFLSTPSISMEQIRLSRNDEFADSGRSNELCHKYSDACIELCNELGLKVIDMWNLLQQQNDWRTACFTDGIHLSEEGSKLVVKEILRTIREAAWEPSLHWKSMPTEFSGDSPYDFLARDGKTTINISESTNDWDTRFDSRSSL